MFRNIFAFPNSTPIPMLRFELGSLKMKELIDVKKLNFLHHLQNLESQSLASEIYQTQVKFNFPGLVYECRKLLSEYNLPNIIDEETGFSKQNWSKMVKNVVKQKSETNIYEEFKGYSKLKNKGYENEKLEIKEYIMKMTLRDSRTFFKVRSSMLKTKMTMKSNQKYAAELWRCNECMSMDSQSHIVWCPAYAPLREGKNLNNDEDLVKYFQTVMKIREEKENEQT